VSGFCLRVRVFTESLSEAGRELRGAKQPVWCYLQRRRPPGRQAKQKNGDSFASFLPPAEEQRTPLRGGWGPETHKAMHLACRVKTGKAALRPNYTRCSFCRMRVCVVHAHQAATRRKPGLPNKT
jgi:hypothetical protein